MSYETISPASFNSTPGIFFVPAFTRPDARQKQQIPDTPCVRIQTDRFRVLAMN